MRLLLGFFAMLSMSCSAPRAETPDTVPAPDRQGTEGVRGTVQVVGSAPINVQVVLQPEDGGSIRIVGPLREELRRLAGAEVQVHGGLEPSPDPMADRQIQATAYDILSIDGQPVLAGTVERRVNQWVLLRTTDGRLVYLSGAPDHWKPGQKVWAQGPSSLIVQSFGELSQ